MKVSNFQLGSRYPNEVLDNVSVVEIEHMGMRLRLKGDFGGNIKVTECSGEANLIVRPASANVIEISREVWT